MTQQCDFCGYPNPLGGLSPGPNILGTNLCTTCQKAERDWMEGTWDSLYPQEPRNHLLRPLQTACYHHNHSLSQNSKT